jgi:hypothetical protein
VSAKCQQNVSNRTRDNNTLPLHFRCIFVATPKRFLEKATETQRRLGVEFNAPSTINTNEEDEDLCATRRRAEMVMYGQCSGRNGNHQTG